MLLKRWWVVGGGLWVSAAMAQVNPTLANYLSGMATAEATITPAYHVSVPKIPVLAQVYPVINVYFNQNASTCNPSLAAGVSGACPFNNTTTLIGFVDAHQRTPPSGYQLNIPLSPLNASSQYTAYCAANPSDNCPAATTYDTRSLANLDALMAHITSVGSSYTLAPEIDGLAVTACGLTSSSTEAQVQACWLPKLVAACERYSAALGCVVAHEFSGVTALYLGQTLSTSQATTLVTAMVGALQSAVPALPLGIGFDTGESAYVTALGGISGLTYAGFDIYNNGSCDPTGYATALNSTVATLFGLAKTAGLQVRVDESARFVYCQIGGAGSNEVDALVGCGDELWGSKQTSTLTAATLTASSADDAWMNAFVSWAAVHGALSVAIFSTPQDIWQAPYDATGVTDNCASGTYVGNMAANLSGNTETGTWLSRISTGWQSGLKGRAGFTGQGGLAGMHWAYLTWMESGSVAGFDVYRSLVSGGPYVQVNALLVTGTTYTDRNVTAGTTYYYVVTAIATNGQQSGYSNQVSATIPTP